MTLAAVIRCFSTARGWITLFFGAAGDLPGSATFGRLAQLVRALLSHGRGHRFKSRVAHSHTTTGLTADHS